MTPLVDPTSRASLLRAARLRAQTAERVARMVKDPELERLAGAVQTLAEAVQEIVDALTLDEQVRSDRRV